MLNIDLEVKEDCIIMDSDNKEMERKYFLFSYLLSSHFNDAREGTTEKQSITAPSLLTSYSNSGMKLTVKKNSRIQSTMFAFSEVWMEAQLFSEGSQMESNLFNLFLSTKVTPLTKP